MKKEDLNAILGNEEVMKKIAAKVLDLAAQRPQDDIVCKGYFCNMGEDQSIRQKELWKKHLKEHEMTIDDEVLAQVIKQIPLSDEEISQTIIELKTDPKKELKEVELSDAAKKVLADNVIMARKGNVFSDTSRLQCTSCGPNSLPHFGLCTPYGPNNLDCIPCAPNQGHPGSPIFCTICGPTNNTVFACHVCGPSNGSSPGGPVVNCVPCAPNRSTATAPTVSCVACGPSNQNIPGAPVFSCAPCSPNQASSPGAPYNLCTICGPNTSGIFTDPCSAPFRFQGCVAAFDPVPDWRDRRELFDKVTELQNQLQILQDKLARI